MPRTLIPLDVAKHADLRFDASQPFHFAKSDMLCPVVSGELRQMARDYVIVFPMEGGLPQALLGVDQGVNAYVAESGHWLCRYVPAHYRRHPFYAVPKPSQGASTERIYAIGIDEHAPHLSRDQGQALFGSAGDETVTLKKIKGALSSLEKDSTLTMKMVAELEKNELLIPQNFHVKTVTGEERGVTGFRGVDSKKLMALEPQALGGLQKSGALFLAYAHLISLANLRDGVLVRGTDTAQEIQESGVAIDSGDIDLSFLN